MNLDNSNPVKKIKIKTLEDFSNEFELNISSLAIISPTRDCFIQFSPDNNYMAYTKNNLLEIYIKENISWKKNFELKLSFLEKKKIKGINWSKDSSMILLYGSDNERQSFIRAINRNDPDWECNIEFKGDINHASFYPDSKSIVYIKSPINSLNIFSLLKHKDLTNKNSSKDIDKIKYEFFNLKFGDERCINYIKNNNNLFMLVPCYGLQSFDKKNIIATSILPSDYLIILANKKVFQRFKLITKDLDRIIPINNKNSLFLAVEKEFYKLPFFIYNLYGDILFKSNEYNNVQKILTNPCLLYNENFNTKFILVQEPEGILEILGCETIITLSKIYFCCNYNKLYDISKNNIKNNRVNNNIINCNSKNLFFNNFNYNNGNNDILDSKNFFNKDDILFLEEKKINKNEENYINGQNTEENNIKKNKNDMKLIKVKSFNMDIFCENDYLLHAEISPIKNYICFINKNNPYYLFFGSYYQSGVFKIIKFKNNILSFKWSSIQDVLLVTLDSPFFYLITKDNYINYELDRNYKFNNIVWSASGQEVILSSEEIQVKMVAILY